MRLIKNIFVFLFALTTISLAQGISERDSLDAEKRAQDIQIDYEEHYKNLIKQEQEEIDTKITKGGISGIALGAGIGFSVLIFKDNGSSSKDRESIKEVFKTEAVIIGIGLIAVGTIGLSYNLYALYNKDGLYNRLDSYKRAHDIYKRRRQEINEGAKLVLTPTFNVTNNSAGMNLSLLF
ncbi:hypothetical protein [Fibrobacter sp.]|uniref:hypothetical protein n=1 Tax=Fibrobacter sp. TaxID=35828 RepID=UPI00386F980E